MFQTKQKIYRLQEQMNQKDDQNMYHANVNFKSYGRKCNSYQKWNNDRC